MKLQHMVLLVAGAGFAGGLAYKMTQPPPIEMPAPVSPAVNGPPSTPDIPARKPSPIPQQARVTAPVTTSSPAPDTVYTEPPKPVVRKSEPAPPAKPVRKNEPILAANNKPLSSKPAGVKPLNLKPASVKPLNIKPANIKSAKIRPPNSKPKQWVPGKYESGDSVAVAKATPPPTLAKPAPVVIASIDKSAAPPVVPAIEQEPAPAPPPTPHQATLQTGMTVAVRLMEPLSSNFSRSGATFAGELVDPLIADGFVIAERGAPVAGRIVESFKAGRFTGTSRLELALTNVYTSDGQQVGINTQPWMTLGDSLPADTVLRFRLTSKTTITERQLAASK
jgi:hypothetical protein